MDEAPEEPDRAEDAGHGKEGDVPSQTGAQAQEASGTVEGQVPGTQSRVDTSQTDEGQTESQ